MNKSSWALLLILSVFFVVWKVLFPQPTYESGIQAFAKNDFGSAIRNFKPLAEKGDHPSQSIMGLIFKYGLGVATNTSEAGNWYRKAAEGGIPTAMVSLGKLLQEGDGCSKDEVEAFRWFERSAKLKNTDGLFETGMCFYKGKGAAQDFSQARQYFEAAGKEGPNVNALYYLGIIHNRGKGLEKNPALAMKYFLQAADHGLKEAQFQVGEMYRHGVGGKKDLARAEEYFRKSSENGYPFAMESLGEMLAKKDTSKTNQTEATMWFRRAAEGGDFDAAAKLAIRLKKGSGTEINKKEAEKWACLAAEQGNPSGQYEYARMLLDRTSKEDREKGIGLLIKSAQNDNREANIFILESFIKGINLPEKEVRQALIKVKEQVALIFQLIAEEKEASTIFSTGIKNMNTTDQKKASDTNAKLIKSTKDLESSLDKLMLQVKETEENIQTAGETLNSLVKQAEQKLLKQSTPVSPILSGTTPRPLGQ
ncbi:MAG: sel1 repeat family protein [Candidatus Riflebacteria bacterium]|nr:sel1 repeat family protein [Candidatus Riflebacteria bacterium]